MVDTFIQLINTIGFPVAMVVYFIYDKQRTTEPLIEAINNNTNILTRLLDKLGIDDMAVNEHEE